MWKLRTSLVSLLLAPALLASTSAASRLERDFAHPPDSARPWVYWFWLNGNITSNGVTADLEAMKHVGIGGVLIMEVDQGAPVGPIDFAGARWRVRDRVEVMGGAYYRPSMESPGGFRLTRITTYGGLPGASVRRERVGVGREPEAVPAGEGLDAVPALRFAHDTAGITARVYGQQFVRNFQPLQVLAPSPLLAGGLAAPLTRRIGPHRVVQLGLAIEVVGIVAVGLTFSADRPAWQFCPQLFVYGIGGRIGRRTHPAFNRRQRLQAIGEARVVIGEYLTNPEAFVPAKPAPAGRGAFREWMGWGVAFLCLAGIAAMGFIHFRQTTAEPPMFSLEVFSLCNI